MKILKIISIISFLLIGGVNEKSTMNFLAFPYIIFSFFSDLFNGNLEVNIVLGFLMILALIGTLIIFYRSINQKILILCFIAMSLFSIYISGILDSKPNIWFVVTSAIFIISSLMIIIKSPTPQQLKKQI
ncbi:hypothetical protein DSC47_09830 [Elizabethkingia miricola]|uniref:hypothetical protein n=1 Tax=Elizabethkingia bruuniana TaxID=1756149 RepID=UPI00099A2233|nr:hypothetical protein [Elizabethkingia bruuniana]OPC66413.1 hypothetical protein BAY13_16880 [Elizabethkingia bruuniana]RBI91589.1 hypothetical protein DSC47_09830 [Elizabethkingia miricola]